MLLPHESGQPQSSYQTGTGTDKKRGGCTFSITLKTFSGRIYCRTVPAWGLRQLCPVHVWGCFLQIFLQAFQGCQYCYGTSPCVLRSLSVFLKMLNRAAGSGVFFLLPSPAYLPGIVKQLYIFPGDFDIRNIIPSLRCGHADFHHGAFLQGVRRHGLQKSSDLWMAFLELRHGSSGLHHFYRIESHTAVLLCLLYTYLGACSQHLLLDKV